MINSGFARKYLLYSIGEIALVVIGILIALQINNRNQDRIDRQEEKRILLSVSEEMNGQRWRIQRGIGVYNQVLASSERLLMGINNPALMLPVDTIDYDLHYLPERWLLGKSDQSNIYDALTGSGELGLITSAELRKLLNFLKGDLMLLASYEEIQVTFVNNQLLPFLNKFIDGIAIFDIQHTIRAERYGYKFANENLPIDVGIFETAYNDIMTSREFSNLLIQHMRNTSVLLPIYGRLEGNVENVDSILLGENTIVNLEA